eukprot:8185472-Pyramimonas_sp.AAC.1
MSDQSDAGSVGIFACRTNQTHLGSDWFARARAPWEGVGLAKLRYNERRRFQTTPQVQAILTDRSVLPAQCPTGFLATSTHASVGLETNSRSCSS